MLHYLVPLRLAEATEKIRVLRELLPNKRMKNRIGYVKLINSSDIILQAAMPSYNYKRHLLSPFLAGHAVLFDRRVFFHLCRFYLPTRLSIQFRQIIETFDHLRMAGT